MRLVAAPDRLDGDAHVDVGELVDAALDPLLFCSVHPLLLLLRVCRTDFHLRRELEVRLAFLLALLVAADVVHCVAVVHTRQVGNMQSPATAHPRSLQLP